MMPHRQLFRMPGMSRCSASTISLVRKRMQLGVKPPGFSQRSISFFPAFACKIKLSAMPIQSLPLAPQPPQHVRCSSSAISRSVKGAGTSRPFASAAGSRVVVLGDEEAYNKALKKDGLTIVYFTAAWCGPCRMVSPVYEMLSQEHTSADFLKVDVDDLPEVAAAAGVSAMPTFKFMKSGKCVDTIVGADVEKLKSSLSQHAA